MNLILSIPALCMLVGIICGIISNSYKDYMFWFMMSGLFALGILLGR